MGRQTIMVDTCEDIYVCFAGSIFLFRRGNFLSFLRTYQSWRKLGGAQPRPERYGGHRLPDLPIAHFECDGDWDEEHVQENIEAFARPL